MLFCTRSEPFFGRRRLVRPAAAGAIAVLSFTIGRPSSAEAQSPATAPPVSPGNSSSAGAPPQSPAYPGYPPPAGYQPPPPGYQQPQPGYQQPQPGYPQPPAGNQQPYQQPGPPYPPPPPAGYQPPPPGYQPPGAPQPGPPGYPPPGYAYAPPILPPPPPRRELAWSIRFNLFDLLLGRVTGEVEYAFAGPFSLTIAPQYIFGDRRGDSNSTVTASGAGIYGELGVWVEGRPLRGYFLKAHAGHQWITFHGYNGAEVDDPATQLGLMLGSQSIYGGWFTLSGGFGVAIDTQAQDRDISAQDTKTGAQFTYTIPAAGLFGNGWDLLSQIGIGGSF